MPTASLHEENDINSISVKEAAQSTGYSTSYISRLCRAKKISCERKDNEWEINTQSLRKFVGNQNENKKAYAAILSHSRSNTYHSVQTEKKIKLLLSSRHYARTISQQSIWQKIAFAGVSLAVIFVSGSFAVSDSSSAFLHVGTVTLQESLLGFNEIVNGAAHEASQRIIAAAVVGNENYKMSAHTAIAQTTSLDVSIQNISTALNIVLPVINTTAPQYPVRIIQKTFRKMPVQHLDLNFYSAAAASATHISVKNMPNVLVDVYVGSGQFVYSLIEKGLNGYYVLLVRSGVSGLAFGATARDILANTPFTAWHGLKIATQFSVNGYVALLTTFVTGIQSTLYEGNNAVLTLGTMIFSSVKNAASAHVQ